MRRGPEQRPCDEVRNIPLVVFIKAGGEMNDKLVGASSKDAIKAKIDALL